MRISLFNKIRPFFLLFVGGACLGSFPPLSKLGMQIGIPPISYMFYAAAGAGVALLIWAWWYDKPPSLKPKHLAYYFGAAITAYVIPSLATVFIVVELGAGLVALAFTLVPVLTYFFALLLRLELFNTLRVLGIFAGLAGVLIVLIPAGSVPGSGKFIWMLGALIIPLSLALGGIFRTVAWPVSATPLQLSTGTMLMSAIILWSILFWSGESQWPTSMQPAAAWIIASQSVTAFLAYLIIFEIQKSYGVVFQSLIGYVSTITGVLVGFFIYNEETSPSIWMAMFFMLLAMGLVNQQQKKVIENTG